MADQMPKVRAVRESVPPVRRRDLDPGRRRGPASTIEQCAEAGADVFVGTAVYNAESAAANITHLRELVAAHRH